MSKLSNHKKLLLIIFLVLILAGGFFVWGTRLIKAADPPVPPAAPAAGTAPSAADISQQAGGTAPGAVIGNLGQAAGAVKGTNFATEPGGGGIRIPVVFHIIDGILWLILWLLSKLVALGANLAESVLSIGDFTKVAVVQTGWQITRDLCNMGFALILLVMAFATILQIETWGLKKILWRLVLAALLINFSLVFAGIIIDFSQILTNYFITAAQGNSGISDQLMNGLAIHNIYDLSKIGTESTIWDKIVNAVGGPSSTMIMEKFAGSILMLVAAFAFFALAFFLIVRIVAIWLLLIFAPLAWLSMIVPGKAHSLWEQWWSNFFKWTFFAPIYAFFLYLAVVMIQNKVFATALTKVKTTAEGQQVFISGFFSDPKILLQYISVIIILLGGLMAAQKFGIYGANGVMKLGKGLAGAAPGAAKFLGKVAERWAAHGAEKKGGGAWNAFRRGTSYLAPKAWKDAWKARQAQKEREAYPAAVGARQDLFNRLITWRYVKGEMGAKTDYEERAVRARRADERKDIKSVNAEELINGYEAAKRVGNTHKMAAYLQALTEQNDQNELLRHYNKSKENGGYDTNYTMDAKGWTNFMEEQTKPMMGAQAAYRLGHDMTRIMESNGQWIGRSFGVDAKTGTYYIVGADGKPITKPWKDMSSGEQDAAAKKARSNAHVEWSKQDPQRQINTTGRFSYIVEDYGKNGETIDMGLTDEGKEKITTLEPSQYGRMHTHSKATLLYRHGKDLKELNPVLYKKLMESVKEATSGMTPEKLKEYITRQTTEIPKLSVEKGPKGEPSEMDNAIAMIKGESAAGGEAPIGEKIEAAIKEREETSTD